MVSRPFFFAAALCAVFASSCGVGGEATVGGSNDPTLSEQQEARAFITCATVRCAAGYECKQRGNHAVCVPQAPATNRCATDADCRLFSDYCTGCDCRALSTSQPNPTCSGPGVQCFADPCMNQVALCKAGACVVAAAPPPPPSGEACGSVTCASGDVCCNASCGICTPPGFFCTQQACL